MRNAFSYGASASPDIPYLSYFFISVATSRLLRVLIVLVYMVCVATYTLEYWKRVIQSGDEVKWS